MPALHFAKLVFISEPLKNAPFVHPEQHYKPTEPVQLLPVAALAVQLAAPHRLALLARSVTISSRASAFYATLPY